MAHDGTGTGWDGTDPTDGEFFSDGAKEIRDLRLGTGIRINKEHDTLAAASAGGEHKEGSAKAYYESTAPTNRPDGATALTAGDAGRLWLDSDTGILAAYTGSAWAILVAGDITADTSYDTGVIPAAALVTSLVGPGLAIAADVLGVVVDDSSIEIDTDTLRVKALGIATTMLAGDAVTEAKLADDAVSLGKVVENANMTSAGKTGTYTGNGSSSGPTITFGFDPDFLLIFLDPDDTSDRSMVIGFQGKTGVRKFTNGADISGALTWGTSDVTVATADGDINAASEVYHYIALRF